MWRLCLFVLLALGTLRASSPDNVLYKALAIDLQETLSETIPLATGITSLTLNAALNEWESCVMAVTAKNAVHALGLTLLPFQNSHTGRTLSADAFQLHEVEFAYTDTVRKVKAPLRLRPLGAPTALALASTRYYWITARSILPLDTGLFTGGLRLDGDGTVCTLTVQFRVYPFRLLEPTAFFHGAFLGSTRAMNPATLQMVKEHGIDAVQFFLGYETVYPGIYASDTIKLVKNVRGHLVVEFHALDSLLKFMKKSGMKGPVVPSIGNDSKAHLERDICDAFPAFKLDTGLTVGGKRSVIGPLNDPIFDTLLLSAVRQFKDKIESYGFEMVLLIYDEPTERLMTQLADRYALIKGAFPTLRTYGVAMDQLAYATQIAPYTDIFVANGGWSNIWQYAKAQSKDFWVYAGAPSGNTFAESRVDMGLRFQKYNPGGCFFWALNYYGNNPYVDYDGSAESGQAALFPPCSATTWLPVASPSLVGVREAHDDMLYAKTVATMVTQATGVAAARIRPLYNHSKTSTTDYGTGYRQVDSLRTLYAGWILEILAEEGGLFPEIAVATERSSFTEKSHRPFLQVSPNPFNPTARLVLDIATFGGIVPKVELRTVSGRVVSELVIAERRGEQCIFTIDGQNLAGGLYLLSATSRNKTLTTKAILLK